MRILNLSELGEGYEHVYLSPHLDDAALSSGGAIACQRRAGERVLVVTICTAAPAPDEPFRPLALELHSWWRLAPEEVLAARLREEIVSMETLDVDYYWGGQLDAIYRQPRAYDSRPRLFGTPAQGDPLLPAVCELVVALQRLLPQATFCRASLEQKPGITLAIRHIISNERVYKHGRARGSNVMSSP